MRIYTPDFGDIKPDIDNIRDAVRFAAGDYGIPEDDRSQIADWAIVWLRRLSEDAPSIAPD